MHFPQQHPRWGRKKPLVDCGERWWATVEREQKPGSLGTSSALVDFEDDGALWMLNLASLEWDGHSKAITPQKHLSLLLCSLKEKRHLLAVSPPYPCHNHPPCTLGLLETDFRYSMPLPKHVSWYFWFKNSQYVGIDIDMGYTYIYMYRYRTHIHIYIYLFPYLPMSLTQWTWVWANSGRLWRTGKPGVLQSMGSQGVGHDWATAQRISKGYPWRKLGSSSLSP